MVEKSVIETLSRLFKHTPIIQKGGTEVMFFCPNCDHYKKKLNVNTTNGYYHCWVCNFSGKSFRTLLKKLKAPKEFYDILCQIKSKVSSFKTEDTKLFLPSEFVPLYNKSSDIGHKHALSYCVKRGLTVHDIVRYNIGYCSDGVFKNRIIIPSYSAAGDLNFYCGRDIYDSKMKYRLCDSSKDMIGFELFTDFNHPLTLVEGVFDAFSVKYNAVPLFGKTLSHSLKLKLMKQKPPRINVLLDNDAIQNSIGICEFLIQNGIDTRLVLLDGKDPNELGHIKTWNAIDACDRMTESSLFKLKIKYKIL
jgi:DNA primase